MISVSWWRRFVAAVCLLVGIGGVAQFRFHFDAASPGSMVRLGRTLPPLRVDGSGTEFDLRQVIAGRKSIIIFYSPACRICADELPALLPFPEGLRLIMVSETRLPGHGSPPLLPGAVFFYDRWNILQRSFATRALPTILFIDESGILRAGLVGSHPREVVQARLREFASAIY